MLTVVCGLIDGTCLLALGGVFAQLMTGNLLFLGLSIGAGGEVSGSRIVAYLGAIIPFCIGAVIAGQMMHRLAGPVARRRGLITEWALVILGTILAFVMIPTVTGTSPIAALSGDESVAASHETQNLIVVAVLALAMGLHGALLKVHGVKDIATNVMTMTLTTIFSEGPLAGDKSGAWKRKVLSVVIFVASAALAAWLIRFGVAAPLIAACVVFTLALVPLLSESPTQESS